MPTSKSMILTTQIIYFAIVTVVVLFAGVTLLLKYTGKIPVGPDLQSVTPSRRNL